MPNYPVIPERPYLDKDVYGTAMNNRVPVLSTVGRGPRGEAGEQGPKGEPFKFSDMTQEQIQMIIDGVATKMSEQLDEVIYLDSASEENPVSHIAIPFDEDYSLEYVLFVDIEGLTLIPGVDYVINGDAIDLTTPITHAGTRVHFTMLKYEFTDETHNYAYILSLFGPSHDSGETYVTPAFNVSDFVDWVGGTFGNTGDGFNPEHPVSEFYDNTMEMFGANYYPPHYIGPDTPVPGYSVSDFEQQADHVFDCAVLDDPDNPNNYVTMDKWEEFRVGMICHTNGFHAPGDGGAAWYKITNAGTANGMDVIALQDDLFANLILIGDYVTPEMFGAYGDMSSDAVDPHDDTAVFNYILNTLHLNVRGNNGKKYYINDLQIWGDSRRWAIIENCDFMAVDTTSDKGIYLRSFSIIRDCWFRNYNIAVYKTDDHVSVECIIEKCFFERNLIAINLIAAAESVNNVIVKDCYFVKNGTDADDFDAAISATDGYGIYAQGNIDGLTVENNVFEYNSNSGVYIYDNTNSYNLGCNIFGNYFEGNKNAAVYVHCSSQVKTQLSIHSNYYSVSAVNVKNTRFVYWAKGSTTGLVVSENQNLVLSTLTDGANHSFIDKVTGNVKIEPVSGASQYYTLVPIRSSKVSGMVYEVVLDSALNSNMSMKKLDTTTTLGTISNGISHFFINAVDGFYLPRALASGEYIKVVKWAPVDNV